MLKESMKLYSLLLFLCLSQIVSAKAYSIRINLAQNTNDTIFLAHYYNGKILVNDTLVTNGNGQAKTEGKNPLPEGIYTLYLTPEKQIDFLLGKHQNLFISEINSTVKVTGAKESQQFQAYLNFLKDRKQEATEIRNELKNQNEKSDSAAIFRSQLKKLDKEVQKHWQLEAHKNKGTFYGKFIASNIRDFIQADQLPEQIENNDSLKWIYKHNYQKRHYWDHFDLYDLRMWRTPTIRARLDEYFNKMLVQYPDSVLPEAIKLIEGSKKQPEIFENLVSYLLNNSVQSNYMGMENVFVAIAEKYYLSGKAFWASKKTIDKIRQEVYFRKNNLIGSPAKELLLEDKNGQYQSLYQQTTPYTLLVFWDPDCGHCKKQIPDLFNNVFLKTDPSALTVMAVYTQTNKQDWLNFINEHGLDGWINVWDPDQVSHFQVNYNVRSTPMIYLLDKDKTVIAKNLSPETAKELLDRLIAKPR